MNFYLNFKGKKKKSCIRNIKRKKIGKKKRKWREKKEEV